MTSLREHKRIRQCIFTCKAIMVEPEGQLQNPFSPEPDVEYWSDSSSVEQYTPALTSDGVI